MGKEDKIYLAYDGQMGEALQRKTKERIRWILDKAGKNKEILDIGCSQGIISILAAEQGNSVTALDINGENIEFAKNLLVEKYEKLTSNVQFLAEDFYTWKSEKEYDVILLTEVLEHLFEADKFLEKMASMISAQGKVVITVPFGVLNHPDHQMTFYMKNLHDLVSKFFDIEQIEFVERCLGVVAYKKNTLTNKFTIDEMSIQQEENKFFEVDKLLNDKLDEYYQKIKESSEKYKTALKNYEAAKQWHQSALDKSSQLEKQLKVKAEEYELLKGCQEQQQEMLTNYQNLGQQREFLLEEYIKWNEMNKEKIDELERKLSLHAEEIDIEKEKNKRSVMELKNCKAELVETQEVLQQLKTDISAVNNDLLSEREQKIKCINELKFCLEELENKEKVLEDFKKIQMELEGAKSKIEQYTLENSSLQIKIQQEESDNKKMKDMLLECVSDLQEQELFYNELRRYIRKIETQNRYLASENTECKRKLSIITDTKIGRFGIKMYHLLKRIKRKVFAKK